MKKLLLLLLLQPVYADGTLIHTPQENVTTTQTVELNGELIKIYITKVKL